MFIWRIAEKNTNYIASSFFTPKNNIKIKNQFNYNIALFGMKKNSGGAAGPLAPKTLDEKHAERMRYFENIETTVIPAMETQLEELKQQLKTVHGKSHKHIDQYMDVKDRVEQLTKEIKRLHQEKKQYLLKNSNFIFQYFEDKKNISSGENIRNTGKLQQFLKNIPKFQDTVNPDNSTALRTHKIGQQKYWKNVSNELTYLHDYAVSFDTCYFCNSGEFVSQDDEGIILCSNPKCGQYVQNLTDNSRPSNKEPPNEVSYNPYERLNHFKEILSQFLAKPTTQIRQEIIEAIQNRVSKERMSAAQIDYNKMREILRNLGLNKYFEHIQYINSIFGVKPPIMSDELYETLCVLFIEIQRPWAMHCPPNRTNFFNYTYTLYQLCVLLDQSQFLPFIPLLKDRTKQLEQDMTWKKVCKELDWEYIPII
jgi:hypothetical protein